HESWKVKASPDKNGLLQEFIILQPYDESYETDTGTHTSDTSPDLTIGSIYISDGAHDIPNQYGIFQEGSRTVYTAGNELLVSLWTISNIGSANYSGNVSFSAALRAEGEDAFTSIPGTGVMYLTNVLGEGVDGLKALNTISGTKNTALSLGTPSAGNYTLRVTIAMNEACKEAYSLNNSYEVEFTVTDDVYDMSGVSLSVSGSGTPHESISHLYYLPMQIDGLDEQFAKTCVSVAYGTYTTKDVNGNAIQVTDAIPSSLQVMESFSLTPTVKVSNFNNLAVYLLLQPKVDAGKPWPTLALNIAREKTVYLFIPPEYGVDYSTRFTYNCITNTLRCCWTYTSQHAIAAGYDADGRMVWCDVFTTNGETKTVGSDAVSVKMFCVKDNAVPQYATEALALFE
ncbi:MAG: hypothetical protein K6G54_00880, partial [Oscillospiraceae bacterium]|nr:hypothetical protein [Oscillospiraceae bacterium]